MSGDRLDVQVRVSPEVAELVRAEAETAGVSVLDLWDRVVRSGSSRAEFERVEVARRSKPLLSWGVPDE